MFNICPQLCSKVLFKEILPDFADFFSLQRNQIWKKLTFQLLLECRLNSFGRKPIPILNCQASFPLLICGWQTYWHGELWFTEWKWLKIKSLCPILIISWQWTEIERTQRTLRTIKWSSDLFWTADIPMQMVISN